jgi:hypothetical protein
VAKNVQVSGSNLPRKVDGEGGGAFMSLVHLVYASSYIDEYGINLEKVTERFIKEHQSDTLKLMTLFSRGDIFQLIEGELAEVTTGFITLPVIALQFGVTKMLSEPVDGPCLDMNCLGVSLKSLHLIDHTVRDLDLFLLHPEEVERRIKPCVAKKLMMGFAKGQR